MDRCKRPSGPICPSISWPVETMAAGSARNLLILFKIIHLACGFAVTNVCIGWSSIILTCDGILWPLQRSFGGQDLFEGFPDALFWSVLDHCGSLETGQIGVTAGAGCSHVFF